MKAFHIDRNKVLTEGDILSVVPTKKINLNNQSLTIQLEKFFPSGVSQHGIRYFTQPSFSINSGAVIYETIYEYHRKLFYPEKNSRHQSLFAIETKKEVLLWLNKFNLDINDPSIVIWEIDTLDSKVDKLDATLVAGGDIAVLEEFSTLQTTSWADSYWSSNENSSNSLPELLIYPSFKVGKRIDINNL